MNNTIYQLRRARCAFFQDHHQSIGACYSNNSATDRVENVDEGGAAGEYGGELRLKSLKFVTVGTIKLQE
jgi:hypothetical protein